ncbi:MAG TPA: serine/threonine-protein kinase [Pseudonocardiaceae bacterium]|jgi:serine/threonine protein kinase|nr:serine/threonine-protein kinase [Pseudonocardiaceae bacterium]
MTEAYDLDEEDNEPVWTYDEGQSLPGGALAIGRLGIGHRCETWLAWSTQPWSPVVVKLARPHMVSHPRAAKTLRREVTAMSGALHPSIPTLIADGVEDAVPHLVMEYVDGPPLDAVLDDTGAMTPANAALMCVQILAAVTDLHSRGLAHLDLKPPNVVLRDGRPVVIDYGSARVIGTPQPAGHPIGTAGYAAPEQEECRPISATMDCYGVGTVLYEALTDEAPGPDGVVAALPAEFAHIVTGLLEPEPERRMTAQEAMLALAAALPPDNRPWPAWLDERLSTRAAV